LAQTVSENEHDLCLFLFPKILCHIVFLCLGILLSVHCLLPCQIQPFDIWLGKQNDISILIHYEICEYTHSSLPSPLYFSFILLHPFFRCKQRGIKPKEIEQLFQRMKKEFWSSNSVQALSQILVLGGKCEEAVQHILELRDTLRSKKIRLDKTYTLPALGVLALLPVGGDVIAQDIWEAQAFLRAQKGFGAFSVTSQELLLYAAAIISSSYAEDMDAGITAASISTSIASIIIAQQAAMIAAFAASGAAASPAASS